MTKYLKYPKTKSRDGSIRVTQDSFMRMMRDVPNSELPNDAVADAVNILLCGDRFKVRPGTSEWSSVTLPVFLALTGLSKTGSTVTADQDFTSAMIGKYIIYADGSIDQIINISGTDAVADNSTARASTTGNVMGHINAIIWHKKSQKIFIHIDTEIYYTDYQVTSWTQVYSSIGSLTDTKSTFDQFLDYLYIFNANGHFRIDTDETPYGMIQINTAVPPQTINIDTSKHSLTESERFRFGRRYLYSMSKLGGTNIIRDRVDGSKIIKETGTNAIDTNNDYEDYLEIFFHNQVGDTSQETITARFISLSTRDIDDWIGNIISINVTVTDHESNETTVTISADLTSSKNWNDIAKEFTDQLRSELQDYPSIHCSYNGTVLFMYSGRTDLSITSIGSPSTTYGIDGSTSTYWGSSVNSNLDGSNIIGQNNDPALEAPENGWTHYSIYSTKYFSDIDEDFNITDKNQFIWSKDLRIIAIIGGSITDSLMTISSGEIEKADNGDIAYFEDGRKAVITDVDGSTIDLEYIHASISPNISLGANDLKYGSVSGNTLTLTPKKSGTQTSINTNKLTDSGATFITDNFGAGDYVKNTNSNNFAQVINIQRGINEFAYVGTVNDDNANFITNGVQSGDTVKNLALGTTTTVDGAPASENEISLIDTNLFESGNEAYVTYPANAETQLPLDTDIFTSNDGYEIYHRIFTAADVGKTIYWADGTTSLIIAYISETKVTLNTPTTKSSTGFVTNLVGRNFTDTISDELLENRSIDFPLNQRFWTALPSGELGEISPGFMTVAERLSQKAYYSQFNFEIIQLAGHYRADFQFLEFKDRLTEIQEMPNQIIFWCLNSTWRTQTNVINTIEDDRLSESIAIQSGLSIVDGYVGAMDKNGVIEIGIGQKMVITSEPGIRIFDGYKYSDNLVIDEGGRGLILKDLQKMRHRFVAIYEPNLYGFMFWSNTDQISMSDSSEISKTDVCYRLAIRPEQGFGFSELNGTDWIFPSLGGGPILINDGNEEQFIIIFDYKTGKPYKLSTRESTAISGRTISWVDKGSTEIDWSLKFKEHASQTEEKKIKFIEQYFHMRPNNEANQGASGYDSYGFRNNLTVKVEAFIDGKISADGEVNANRDQTAVFTNVNQLSTLRPNLAYPYNIEGHRIQHKISGTGSEIECVKYQVLYDEKDAAVVPTKVTSERNLQRQLAAPFYWVTRGSSKTLNRGTGKEADTINSSVGETTGPDGNSDSAHDFTSFGSFLHKNISVGEERTILFWAQKNTSDLMIYRETAINEIFNGIITISWTDVQMEISYKDSTKITLALDFTNPYYFHLKMTSTQFILKVYDATGTLVTTETGSVTPSGTYNSWPSLFGTGTVLFDFRSYNTDDISDNAVAYWIRDISEQEGYSLLPENGT